MADENEMNSPPTKTHKLGVSGKIVISVVLAGLGWIAMGKILGEKLDEIGLFGVLIIVALTVGFADISGRLQDRFPTN